MKSSASRSFTAASRTALISAVVLVATLAVSCERYDDTGIKEDISSIKGSVSSLEGRVQSLESQVSSANTNISSLQTIVGSLQKNVFVTSVTETENGYEISFSDGKKAVIANGKDGKDGQDGKDGVDGTDGKDGQDGKDGKDGTDGTDGKDGKDGVNGEDGHTPEIGVRQDEYGLWYWTLDGEWLTSEDGGKVKAVGTDGKDGKNGKNGKDGEDGEDGINGKNGTDGNDGITPQLKIEEDYWYVSTDDGSTWTKLDKARGDDGEDGDSFFQSVTYDGDYVYLTLTDGTELKLSRGLNNVSALAVVPDYSDGSVEAETGDFEVRFDVIPESSLEAVGALDLSAFSLKAVYTKTRASAGDDVALTIESKSVNDGRLVLTIDGSALGEEFTSGALGVSVCLTIDDGVSAVTSGYFPLYSTPMTSYDISGVLNAPDDSSVEFTALVVAVSTTSMVVTDRTNYLYVYNPTTLAAIGDEVSVSGVKKTYGNVVEIDKDATVTVNSSGNKVTQPTAKDITLSFDPYTSTRTEYITFIGTLAKSGNYFNVNVEGASAHVGSVSFPVESLGMDGLDGQTVRITGYFIGFSGKDKYINIVCTEVESNPEQKYDVSQALAASDGESVTITGIIVARDDSQWRIVTDGTNNVYTSILKKDSELFSIGVVVRITGFKSTFENLPRIAYSSSTISSSDNYPQREAKDITATFDTYSSTVNEYISFTGTLSDSGSDNYYVSVEGATSKVGRIQNPYKSLGLAGMVGQTVKVTGYLIGLTDQYIRIICTEAEVVTDP